MFFKYGTEQGVKVAVYRFPNLMGHSRPDYNSVVSTFCNAIANNLPYTVSDRNNEVELLYIDDLVIVVHGHSLIQDRNINTNEMVEFEISGKKIEAVYMIPGWTHKIINLSNTEDFVTIMTCNEVFNPDRPDTFSELV